MLLAGSVSAQDIPLTNWTVPTANRWQVQSSSDLSNATVFVPVTPCRLIDTRNPVGPFGGPQFIAGETRNYDVSVGPCTGLPAAPAAYSMNFTIVNYNVASGSFITAWNTGSPRPGVSTVNFGTGPPVANAAVVATGASGQISVYAGAATDIIIDLNGYFLGSVGTLNPGKVLSLIGTVDNSGVIFGRNQSNTSGLYTTGVLGTITSTSLSEGSGVMGYTTYGNNWGVKGLHTGGGAGGINAGGVLGVHGPSRPVVNPQLQVSGVRGEATTGYGVLGLTVNTAGVAGWMLDAQGNTLRGANLGQATYAVWAAGDIGASGTKFFIDPHPTDATKVIRFISLEGPEAGTYFRGRGRFVRGHAVIDVPEAFRMTTEEDGLTVNVTPIGGLAMVAVMRQSLDRIEVESSKDVEFAYIVHGVRRGYRDFQPIAEGREFIPESPNARMPLYLNEEQKRRLIENGTYNADGSVNLETYARVSPTTHQP